MPEIVLLSGKGGTGKTSLAAAFATLEKNLVVADCDVDAANLYLVLQPEDHTCQPFITGYKARIDYNSCTQCGLCMEYCRFGAISIATGRAYPKEKITISSTACDGCKLCARICPIQAISMIPSDKSLWFAGNFRNGKMIHARLAPGEENSGKLVSLVREKARQTAKETGWQRIIIDGPPG
ncbi:MAG: 4Fe-4S binding protein, partial [Bacteroidales bacterium]|nr:4Fe-4S binding protein [Bacteroidales bacterium]